MTEEGLRKENPRFMSTPQLIEIHWRSIRNHYNRTMPNSTVLLLDPEGTHVVRWVLDHEHAQGQLVEPHYRVRAWIKLLAQREAEEMILDMETEDYDGLPEIERDKTTGRPRRPV